MNIFLLDNYLILFYFTIIMCIINSKSKQLLNDYYSVFL